MPLRYTAIAVFGLFLIGAAPVQDACRMTGEGRFPSAFARECKGWFPIYASIPNGEVWYGDKDGTDPQAQRIQTQAERVQASLRHCGIRAHITPTRFFDRFEGDFVVVHAAPFRTAVAAGRQLARARTCGMPGYVRFSEYGVAGRD